MPDLSAHKNIFMALAAAQTEMSAPIKGSVNPAFRSKYADLADVVNAVAPALGKNGIAFSYYMSRDDFGLWMTTVLAHGESDTKIECPVPLLISKQDMHGLKSATTYAKRIGLESVTGVAPDDDDGNAAARSSQQPARQQRGGEESEPAQASGQPLTQQAAPESPLGAVTLTKAMGEAIVLGIDNCADKAALDAYVEALRNGPNGFAASHPKIKVAVSQRYAALDVPIVLGDLRVPEGVEQ